MLQTAQVFAFLANLSKKCRFVYPANSGCMYFRMYVIMTILCQRYPDIVPIIFWYSANIGDMPFPHHHQGRIDLSTVNTNCPTGMYFLIHPEG